MHLQQPSENSYAERFPKKIFKVSKKQYTAQMSSEFTITMFFIIRCT